MEAKVSRAAWLETELPRIASPGWLKRIQCCYRLGGVLRGELPCWSDFQGKLNLSAKDSHLWSSDDLNHTSKVIYRSRSEWSNFSALFRFRNRWNLGSSNYNYAIIRSGLNWTLHIIQSLLGPMFLFETAATLSGSAMPSGKRWWESYWHREGDDGNHIGIGKEMMRIILASGRRWWESHWHRERDDESPIGIGKEMMRIPLASGRRWWESQRHRERDDENPIGIGKEMMRIQLASGRRWWESHWHREGDDENPIDIGKEMMRIPMASGKKWWDSQWHREDDWTKEDTI